MFKCSETFSNDIFADYMQCMIKEEGCYSFDDLSDENNIENNDECYVSNMD